MRNRHFPRLCRTCLAPMAGQEDTCWRCGAQWASEDVPRTKLRVIPGGRLTPPATKPTQAPAALDAGIGCEAVAVALDAVAAGE
jgi:hypothetical protein